MRSCRSSPNLVCGPPIDAEVKGVQKCTPWLSGSYGKKSLHQSDIARAHARRGLLFAAREKNRELWVTRD